MPRETLAEKKKRALSIVGALEAHMPEAKIELDYKTPLELLVAVILSAQCTDARVNLATPALFKNFKSARDYAKATTTEIESYIKSLGLYRNKAKNLVALGQQLVEKHDGIVPTSRLLLSELPGVGNKTAGVVSMHLGGDKSFPVDTHVMRLAYRLGLTKQATPDAIESKMKNLLPEALWFSAHQLLIWHGRRTCFARGPACDTCIIRTLCPRLGVESL